MLEHRVGGDAEVDQAGDLVHARALELVDQRQAALRRAEQGAGAVVAREGVLQQRVHVLGDSGCESMISTGLLPCSPPRCTKVGNVQAACLIRSTALRR